LEEATFVTTQSAYAALPFFFMYLKPRVYLLPTIYFSPCELLLLNFHYSIQCTILFWSPVRFHLLPR